MDKWAKDFENEEEPELFKVVKYTFMGIFAYFVVLRMEVDVYKRQGLNKVFNLSRKEQGITQFLTNPAVNLDVYKRQVH